MTAVKITTKDGVDIKFACAMSIIRLVMTLRRLVKEGHESSDPFISSILSVCTTRPFKALGSSEFGAVCIDFQSRSIVWRRIGSTDNHYMGFDQITKKEAVPA